MRRQAAVRFGAAPPNPISEIQAIYRFDFELSSDPSGLSTIRLSEGGIEGVLIVPCKGDG